MNTFDKNIYYVFLAIALNLLKLGWILKLENPNAEFHLTCCPFYKTMVCLVHKIGTK